MSFSDHCVVTLDERGKDRSLIERLGGSVVLHQELGGVGLRGEQGLLKLFQLRSGRGMLVEKCHSGVRKGLGGTTVCLLPRLSATHLFH